jgi:DNA-binding NtrC family response regulator
MSESKSRILIVEDDKNIRESLSAILQKVGYETDVAENGGQAFKKAKKRLYNLVLLDIKLPDMEGTKLQTKLHHNYPQMMKIMVTGYPSLENAMESLNQGADAYVTKPVKPPKLLALIKEKLEEQSQAEKMTEDKVTEWIKSRAQKIGTPKQEMNT